MSNQALAKAIQSEALRRSLEVQELRTAANTVEIDDLPDEVFTTKRLIVRRGGLYLAGLTNASRVLVPGDGAPKAFSEFGSWAGGFQIDPAEFAVPGKNTRFIGYAWAACGNTVPFTTFTTVLSQIGTPSGSSSDGDLSCTEVGAVTGSTLGNIQVTTGHANTVRGPAESTITPGLFEIPSAGRYAFRVANAATIAANVVVRVEAALYVVNT